MRGAPLLHCFKAISNIIEAMLPEDRLHLVTYDNEATAVVENGTIENKAHLLDLINKVEASGGTNIESGLKLAKKLLVKYQSMDKSTRK